MWPYLLRPVWTGGMSTARTNLLKGTCLLFLRQTWRNVKLFLCTGGWMMDCVADAVGCCAINTKDSTVWERDRWAWLCLTLKILKLFWGSSISCLMAKCILCLFLKSTRETREHQLQNREAAEEKSSEERYRNTTQTVPFALYWTVLWCFVRIISNNYNMGCFTSAAAPDQN